MRTSLVSLPLVLTAVFAFTCAVPATAHASGYGVSGSGGGYSGSGTLTATDQLDGSYLITDASGTGFQGLFAVGGFHGNDNLLFPTGAQYVDGAGFSFTIAGYGDTDNVNISWDGSQYGAYIVDEGGNVMKVPVTFSLTANPTPQLGGLVHLAFSPMGAAGIGSTSFSFSFSPDFGTPNDPTPEPSSLALLGTGAMGLAWLVRWRTRGVLAVPVGSGAGMVPPVGVSSSFVEMIELSEED